MIVWVCREKNTKHQSYNMKDLGRIWWWMFNCKKKKKVFYKLYYFRLLSETFWTMFRGAYVKYVCLFGGLL